MSHRSGEAVTQGSGEPVTQAAHLIQNVATGVTKAATSAILTAKDVFYSLQAKQVSPLLNVSEQTAIVTDWSEDLTLRKIDNPDGNCSFFLFLLAIVLFHFSFYVFLTLDSPYFFSCVPI